jgi:hypothetical protein
MDQYSLNPGRLKHLHSRLSSVSRDISLGRNGPAPSATSLRVRLIAASRMIIIITIGLAALERLVTSKGLLDHAALARRNSIRHGVRRNDRNLTCHRLTRTTQRRTTARFAAMEMIARCALSPSSHAPAARRYAASGLDRSARPSKPASRAANDCLRCAKAHP